MLLNNNYFKNKKIFIFFSLKLFFLLFLWNFLILILILNSNYLLYLNNILNNLFLIFYFNLYLNIMFTNVLFLNKIVLIYNLSIYNILFCTFIDYLLVQNLNITFNTTFYYIYSMFEFITYYLNKISVNLQSKNYLTIIFYENWFYLNNML